MPRALIAVVLFGLPCLAAAESFRFPDVGAMLTGARGSAAGAENAEQPGSPASACAKDPKCLLETPFQRLGGKVVFARLKAERIVRKDRGVTLMAKPYFEVRAGLFVHKYRLGGYGAIDRWVCKELKGAPHPARVLDSAILREPEVAVAGPEGLPVAARQSIFIDWLECQHDPDTAYE